MVTSNRFTKAGSLLMMSVLATGTVTSCSSNTIEAPYEQDVESQELAPIEMDAGDPAHGVFPIFEDGPKAGQTRYGALTFEYPQGKAFVEGFREIFPQFGEDMYERASHYPLRNAQEVCSSLQMMHSDSPSRDIRLIQARIEQDAPVGTVISEEDAISVYNLSINMVCPEFIDRKL